MDRIDAMKVFVTALDEGSLVGAARRLKRSTTAVSRALSFLEARVGVELLHRTTRTLKLSEAGERYAAACRRVLIDLEEADMLAGGELDPTWGPDRFRRSNQWRGDPVADIGRFPRPSSYRIREASTAWSAREPCR